MLILTLMLATAPLTEKDRDAKYMCKEIIERSVKDPSSIDWDFKWMKQKDEVILAKDGLFLWQSYFYANNSYGARVKTEFDCAVDENGHNIGLQIGSQFIGDRKLLRRLIKLFSK